MSFRALRRLLFADSRGKTIVRPSKRPVAGWLALTDDAVYALLRDHEPAVLLAEGDPESLSLSQRNQALCAYVKRYGKGGWRGLTLPEIQIHRFASPALADEINRLWTEGIENPEIRLSLLNMIELGSIKACADVAYRAANDPGADARERVNAIDALAALSDPRLLQFSAALAIGDPAWDEDVTHGATVRLFPAFLTPHQLCQVLGRLRGSKRRVGDLAPHLARLIETAPLDTPQLDQLRDGLVKLASEGLHWRNEWPYIVSHGVQLNGVLAATCARGLTQRVTDEWLHASVLALRLFRREDAHDDARKTLTERLRQLDAELNARLFWIADAFIQSIHPTAQADSRLMEVAFRDDAPTLHHERDMPWIRGALGDRARSVGERAMLLHAAMYLCPDAVSREAHLVELRPLVVDRVDLVSVIDDRLKPMKPDKQMLAWEKKAEATRKQRERRDAKAHASWVQFWREVSMQPETAFSPERSFHTAWNLWHAMQANGDDSRSSGWNRRFIEDQFGRETADRLRRTLMQIWRREQPTLPSERPSDQRNTFLVRWQLGLAAIYAEAEDSGWAERLTSSEAELAGRLALIELNGLPVWIDTLAQAHPTAVDHILGTELSWELAQKGDRDMSMMHQRFDQAPDRIVQLLLPRLGEWLSQDTEYSENPAGLYSEAGALERVLAVLLTHGSEALRAQVLEVAQRRVSEPLPKAIDRVWLATLMRIDPDLGFEAFDRRLGTITPAPRSEAITWFGDLFGDRRDAINLRSPTFAPPLLLKLLRLAYRHVKPVDDSRHEGSYTPDARDHAERARSEIVGALFDTTGEDGWAAKLEMASDPLFAHFKDRVLAVAQERQAQEIDAEPFDEAQAALLDQQGETPPKTNESMFLILKDRLEELDDVLLQDDSPKEAWAGISEERVMRRVIARELKHLARKLYKVDQEAVTAEEKETDIRLRSVASDVQAVIELKLGDDRTAKDLRDTISIQLVNKYMAAENARSGCLLISLAKIRKWDHPDSGERISVEELMALLRDEAQRVEKMMGGALALSVHLLDLRPRLSVEKRARAIGKT